MGFPSRGRRRFRTGSLGRPEVLERRELLATLVWQGGHGAGEWSHAQNWVVQGTTTNQAPQGGDDLLFVSNENRSMIADLPTDEASIPNSVTFSNSFDLAGGTLSVGAGGLTVAAGVQLSGTSSQATAISIQGGPLQGSGDIVQSGTGELVLSAQATDGYGGQVRSTAGKIRIGISSRLPQPKPKPGNPKPRTIVIALGSRLLIGQPVGSDVEFGQFNPIDAIQVDGDAYVEVTGRLNAAFLVGSGAIHVAGSVVLVGKNPETITPEAGGLLVAAGSSVAPGTDQQNGVLNVDGDVKFLATDGSDETLTIRVDATGASRLAATDLDSSDGVVSHTVDLTGATLLLSPAGSPALGVPMTIVSADRVTGTFKGLPEGATIAAGGLAYQIHYDTQSVTLTRVLATTTLAVAGPATATNLGQPVTLVATISGLSPITGTVQFRDGNILLGSAGVVGNTATFTTARLLPGQRTITASYSGDASAKPSSAAVRVSVLPGTRVASDFNGDGKTDRAVYVPGPGAFRIINSGGASTATVAIGLKGAGASIPAVGDYDGDGISDAAVYVPSLGQFRIRPSTGGADRLASFGPKGLNQSIPTPADYDGDGITDLAVYIPSQGRLAYRSTVAGKDLSFLVGPAGAGKAIPAPADYDGDGKADPAVFVVSTATFLIRSSRTGADSARQFGLGGVGKSIPAPADYDGDGRADLGVYLPGVGVYAYKASGGGRDVLKGFGIRGTGASLPAPGDYDGDGRADLAVYLTTIGAFGIRPSGGGADQITTVGSRGRGASLPATALPGIFTSTVRLLSIKSRKPGVTIS